MKPQSILAITFSLLLSCTTSSRQQREKSESDENFERLTNKLFGNEYQTNNCDFKVNYDGDGVCVYMHIIKQNEILWVKCISKSEDSYPANARGKCAKKICKGLKEEDSCKDTDGPEEIFQQKK